jgi:plastocyanin
MRIYSSPICASAGESGERPCDPQQVIIMKLTTGITFMFGALLVACGGGDSYRPPTGNNPNPNPPSTSNSISVRDNNFSPSATTLAVGTTVTWTWNGADIHNVTFAGGPTSGDQTTGATFQRTFNAAGVFTYSCTRHGGMNGTVTIQ